MRASHFFSGLRRGALALSLLGLAAAPVLGIATVPGTHAAENTSYTSPDQGYSISYPADWQRLSGIHWTAGGPAADLTVMPADHEAALGVIVFPAGNRTWTTAELQTAEDHLILQEDSLGAAKNALVHGVVQLGGVTYQAAFAHLVHSTYGGNLPLASNYMLVLATVQHHRVFLFTGLLYQAILDLRGGEAQGVPTDTPDPGQDAIQGAGSDRVGTGANLDGSAPSCGRLTAGTTAPCTEDAAPRGVDAGNADPASVQVCPPGTIGFFCGFHGLSSCQTLLLIYNVVDCNAAAPPEAQDLVDSLSSITIAAQTPDDTRPLPHVLGDGFTLYTDQRNGFSIEYPAGWPIKTDLSPSGTSLPAVFTLDSPATADSVEITTAPTGPVQYSAHDVQVMADRALDEVGDVTQKRLLHTTQYIGGVTFTVASAPVTIAPNIGHSLYLQATTALGVYRHRIFGGLLTTTGTVVNLNNAGTGLDALRGITPFFSPFYPRDRIFGGFFDSTSLLNQLAQASLESFALNSLAPDPVGQPAPAVGVDGYTRYVSPQGYSFAYPAGLWTIASQKNGLLMRGPDKQSYLAVLAGPSGGQTLTYADLEQLIRRVGTPLIDQMQDQTTTINGVTYLEVQSGNVTIPAGSYINGKSYSVEVLGAVKGANAYIFLGAVRTGLIGTTLSTADQMREQILDIAATITLSPH
jgi:hypothetical protein